MEELNTWRFRYKSIKTELLKLSKKISETSESEDILFYQEICEKYAYHLKKIEKSCHEEIGIHLCNCNFNEEQCEYLI